MKDCLPHSFHKQVPLSVAEQLSEPVCEATDRTRPAREGKIYHLWAKKRENRKLNKSKNSKGQTERKKFIQCAFSTHAAKGSLAHLSEEALLDSRPLLSTCI